MNFTVVYLIGVGASFLAFMAARRTSFPVRIGISILAFSAVSAILTFIMQMSAG